MKKIALTLLAALVSFAVCQAITPAQVVERAAAKLKSSPSARVAYTMTADGNTTQGMLTLSGDRFMLSTPGMVSWYDGETQWTYSEHIGEVNIVTPTDNELQQINPFAIISSLASDFKTAVVNQDKSSVTISFTARSNDTDIRKAVITFNKQTYMPTHIKGTLEGGHLLDITVNSVTPGGALPVSFFRFDAKKYPGVQVVDLR